LWAGATDLESDATIFGKIAAFKCLFSSAFMPNMPAMMTVFYILIADK
jgi:hypothetical protein